MNESNNWEFVYLDVCALCRPFDDQSYVRIRIETESVFLIFEHVRFQEKKLAVSPVHYKEISAIPDRIERNELLLLLDHYGESFKADPVKTRKRAEQLVSDNFAIADAAHVAFAEAFQADFVTCDDRLLQKCRWYELDIWCGNPMEFCVKENLE